MKASSTGIASVPDLLSAASLLLGVLGVLYGLWYTTVVAMLADKPAKHALDNKARFEIYRPLVLYRAVPLALVSALVSMVFLPDGFHLTRAAGSAIVPWHRRYTATLDAFVVVESALILLGAHLTITALRAFAHWRRFSPNRKDSA